jgi:uncharacterized protein
MTANQHGEIDIEKLIKGMKPTLNDGEFVFCFISSEPKAKKLYERIPRVEILMEFKEQEGITLVLSKELADRYVNDGLKYEYVAAWITLEVHSALEAVGLTAAVSKALAKANISANVIAAYHHDHIFVDIKDGIKAQETLLKLANENESTL